MHQRGIALTVILLYFCKPLIQKQTYRNIFDLYALSILRALFNI